MEIFVKKGVNLRYSVFLTEFQCFFCVTKSRTRNVISADFFHQIFGGILMNILMETMKNFHQNIHRKKGQLPEITAEKPRWHIFCGNLARGL